ncbi:MAG: hypothetical protein WB507_07095 [Solirubrobacterales bacterium]
MYSESPVQVDDTVAGNARITGGTAAMLLVLLAAEGVTIPLIGSLRGPHIFIGMLLIPPVLLKLGSTGWRFARYYAGDGGYRRKGPPAMAMRLLAPGLILATLALFATGVMLLAEGPGGSGSLRFLHKASFILWFALMSVHVLGHLLEVPNLAIADWRPRGGREAALAGSGLRLSLLGTSLLAGLALALATLSLAGPWLSGLPGH